MPEQKRGYLTSDFKVFHLRTEEKKDFELSHIQFMEDVKKKGI